jgi:ParB-like chromosome segregation protein Spo0J
MAGDEKSRHQSDIESRGLDEDIFTYEGKVLDGRNRYLACKATGVEPRFVKFDGDHQAALDFIMAKNLHRRHLTSSQASVCSLEAEKHYAEIAKANKGGRPSTNGKPPQTFAEVSDAEDRESRTKAAEMFGTNRQYVSDAKKIAAASPETAEKVKRGEVSIPQAKKDLGMVKEKTKGQTLVDGVLQDDPPDVARDRKKGLIPADSIPEITTVNEDASTAEEAMQNHVEATDERAAIQAEESDDSWVKSLPLYSKLSGVQQKTFVDDALRYRFLERTLDSARKKSSESMNKFRRLGPFGHRVRRFFCVDPPEKWLLCPPTEEGGCGGVGTLPRIGNCPRCKTYGFWVNG